MVVAPGIAVTLARNVRGDELTVRLEASEVSARVRGVDPTVDLAVLTFQAAASPEPVGWATGDEVTIGSDVFALADPAGRGLRITAGAVASVPSGLRGPAGRLIERAIEHTAPLPRGSGGGPLVDPDGQILGLNAIRRDEGLIVAWPAAILRDRVEALASGTSTAPPRLGVALVGAWQTRRLRAAVGLEPLDGLLVRAIEADSPAEQAGVLRGDVIIAVEGSPVTDPDGLYAALDAAAGREIALTVVRGSHELALTTHIGDKR